MSKVKFLRGSNEAVKNVNKVDGQLIFAEESNQVNVYSDIDIDGSVVRKQIGNRERTLTMAEYELLSSSEKNDGTTYYITDGESVNVVGVFAGATESSDGSTGLVPLPQAGDNTKFLRGDGSWQTVSGGSDYNLPTASVSTKGGIKVGSGLQITDEVLSADVTKTVNDLTNYYTKTQIDTDLADKVDKINGKGLSTNDYDNTAKGIVDQVSTNLELKQNIIQYSEMPIASDKNVDNIVQYIGETDYNYINGYYYRCVEDDSETPSTYDWVNIRVQGGSGNIFQKVYIVGNTDYASDWLSETANGSPLIPDENTLYLVNTSGSYYNNLYSYNANTQTYLLVGTQASAAPMTGATAITDGVGGTVPKPPAGAQNKVLFGNGSWSEIPTMVGATTSQVGVKGAVPQPTVTDRSKALFGDGNWHNIYTEAAGSTIMVITGESSLYGRTVTLTDNRTTKTTTMGNNGECFFTDVQMSGTVNISCEDSEGNVARTSLSLSYFGTYTANLTLNFSTIHITTSDKDLYGQNVQIYLNNVLIQTVAFNASGVVDAYVDVIGTYKLLSTVGVRRSQRFVEVSALKQTFNVDMFLCRLYGFHVDSSIADPSSAVTYNAYWNGVSVDNFNYMPAYMDYTTDTFNAGDWNLVDDFIIPKPCMVKYDCSVDYYLDPDDYTKKSDGAASDVANTSYNGNAMMEWGRDGYKIWYAIIPDENDPTSYTVLIADMKLDDTFHAWSFYNSNNELIDHFYTSIYEGSLVSNTLRSISGVSPECNTTGQNEIAYAKANNTAGNDNGVEWYIAVFADRILINCLLTLISKSLDHQTKFGNGNYTGGSGAGSLLTCGTGDLKGMFYGKQTNNVVKVFGMENYYADRWERLAGICLVNGVFNYKFTYGTIDGSTGTGFVESDSAPSGYLTGHSIPTNISSSYIIKQTAYTNGVLLPSSFGGSSSIYYCDGSWSTSGARFAYVGGACDNGLLCGSFALAVYDALSHSSWSIGASLSLKPLA